MKLFERILLKLKRDNLREMIKAIENQMDYYANSPLSPSDMEGISLIPVRDLLDARYQDMLKSGAYISTLAEFRAAADKYTRMAEKDSLSCNSTLKRLHRAYVSFKEYFRAGMIDNHSNLVVTREMQDLFAQNMLDAYKNRNKEMPIDLSSKIADVMSKETESFCVDWLNNGLRDKEQKEEIDQLVFTRLRQNWSDNNLVDSILSFLDKEKTKIDKRETFFSYFKEGKLSSLSMTKQLDEKIIASIVVLVNAKKITLASKLGMALKTLEQQALNGGLHSWVGDFLANWKQGKVEKDAGVEFEEHVFKVIDDAKAVLGQELSGLLRDAAVQSLLDKLCRKELDSELGGAMKEYTLNLLRMPVGLPLCKGHIEKVVMSNFFREWNAKNFEAASDQFVEQLVFSSLDKIAQNIQQCIWKGDTDSKVNELQALFRQSEKMLQYLWKGNAGSRVNELQAQVQRSEKMLEQQSELIQRLEKALEQQISVIVRLESEIHALSRTREPLPVENKVVPGQEFRFLS